jgi:hypothetical protein
VRGRKIIQLVVTAVLSVSLLLAGQAFFGAVKKTNACVRTVEILGTSHVEALDVQPRSLDAATEMLRQSRLARAAQVETIRTINDVCDGSRSSYRTVVSTGAIGFAISGLLIALLGNVTRRLNAVRRELADIVESDG